MANITDKAESDSIPKHGPSSDHSEIADLAADLAKAVRNGSRRALARAITLVESQKDEHRKASAQLMQRCAGLPSDTVRIGITGPPGAGKSTLIEQLGCLMVAKGHQVGVLAFDPASDRGCGAVLGDKTRMEKLASLNNAFIRPSIGPGGAGGVHMAAADIIALCAHAGFNHIIIETVGSGQGDYAILHLCDMLILAQSPAAGDVLQGMKRGIMELVDCIIVTKADGTLEHEALRQKAELLSAIAFMQPRNRGWTVPVLTVSALNQTGLEDLLDHCRQFACHQQATGAWEANRTLQRRHQLLQRARWELSERMASAAQHDPAFHALVEKLVQSNHSSIEAVDKLIEYFGRNFCKSQQA